VTVQIVTLH